MGDRSLWAADVWERIDGHDVDGNAEVDCKRACIDNWVGEGAEACVMGEAADEAADEAAEMVQVPSAVDVHMAAA